MDQEQLRGVEVVEVAGLMEGGPADVILLVRVAPVLQQKLADLRKFQRAGFLTGLAGLRSCQHYQNNNDKPTVTSATTTTVPLVAPRCHHLFTVLYPPRAASPRADCGAPRMMCAPQEASASGMCDTSAPALTNVAAIATNPR